MIPDFSQLDNTKWKLTALFVVVCLAIFASGFFAPRIPMVGGPLDDLIMTDEEKIEALPEDLKLEADKDRIIATDETTEVIKYAYYTDKMVATTTILAEVDGKEKIITEDMNKRTENAMFYKLKTESDKITWQGIFLPNNEYYKIGNEWRQVEIATTTKDAFELQTKDKLINKLFGISNAIADTFYPSSDAIIYNNEGSTWAGEHDASAGDGVQTGDESIVCRYFDSKYAINRKFQTYNTSAIDDGATIASASIFLRTYLKNATDDSRSFNVYTSTHSDTIVTGDYDQCSTTALATAVNYADMSAGGWNEWVFDSTGKSAINKTGNTKICVRDVTKDAANVAPVNVVNIYWYVYSVSHAGTDYDPYMTVTFETPASAPANNGTFIMFE